MLGFEPVIVFPDRDDVKTHLNIQVMGQHVLVDRFDQQPYFFRVHEILRQPKINGRTRFDLNDGQAFAIPGNDIDLGFLENPIPFQDFIAVFQQEICRDLFTEFS